MVREPASPERKPSAFRLAHVLLAVAAAVGLLTVYVATRSPTELPLSPSGKPTDEQRVVYLGRSLLEAGKEQEAVDLMQAYVKANADDAIVRPVLARGLMALGDFEQAERVIDDAIRLAPRNAAALWLKGQLVRRRGGDAAFFFRQAVESPDAGAEIWAAYGLELLSEGRLDDAETFLRRAKDAGLADARTLGPLGEIALRKDKLEEAEMSLTGAVQSAPREARLWAMLAEAQKRSGGRDEAAETLRRGLESCGDRPELLMGLGDVLGELARYEDAAAAYVKAAAFEPLEGEAFLRAARVSFLAGRLDEAAQQLERAARRLGGDEDVEALRERIMQARSAQSQSTSRASSRPLSGR